MQRDASLIQTPYISGTHHKNHPTAALSDFSTYALWPWFEAMHSAASERFHLADWRPGTTTSNECGATPPHHYRHGMLTVSIRDVHATVTTQTELAVAKHQVVGVTASPQEAESVTEILRLAVGLQIFVGAPRALTKFSESRVRSRFSKREALSLVLC